MEYAQLKKLYEFTLENDVSLTKHDVSMPSFETVSQLVKEYKIKEEVTKRIQILDDIKTASFVMSIGDLTMFESICGSSDEFKIEPYYEEVEE